MTERNDFDEDRQLRALLGQADPARYLTPADPQGLARLLEDTMNDDATTTGTTPVRRRGALTWLAGAAAVAVIAGGGFAVASSMGGDDPVSPRPEARPVRRPRPTRSPRGGHPPGAVPGREVRDAHARDPRPVRHRVLRHGHGDRRRRRDAGSDRGLRRRVRRRDRDRRRRTRTRGHSAARSTFEVGQTYYVSATGGQVSACGYSGVASDSQLTQLYDVAFR